MTADAAQVADQQAVAIVRSAVAAQGGEQALRALRSVRFQATGYRNMVEQSERPEGPYVTEFNRIAELHDLAGSRFRRTLNSQVPPFPEMADILVLAGGLGMRQTGNNKGAASSALAQQMQELLALSPERLLLTALDAKDLRLEPNTTLHGVSHRVIAFSLNSAPVRIYLNANSMLPTACDTSGAIAHKRVLELPRRRHDAHVVQLLVNGKGRYSLPNAVEQRAQWHARSHVGDFEAHTQWCDRPS